MENDAAKLNVEIYVTRGRGFKSFSANREIVNALSIIATDSNFSPIVRVAYSVDEEKISRSVTTDTLAIEVTTNGAITPSEAITYTAKLLTEYLKPLTEISENVGEIQVAGSQAVEQAPKSLSTSIEDLNLTIRPYNCLKRLGIQSIQQLTEMSKSEVEKIKNLGKKSVREITNRLKDLGLSLKASKSGF
jgi:DNA-directed RNA polymerase subunit alpha